MAGVLSFPGLRRYHDQHLMIVLVPLGQAEPETYTCGMCGFVMDQLQECPRCKLGLEEYLAGLRQRAQERDQLFEDIQNYLDQEA